MTFARLSEIAAKRRSQANSGPWPERIFAIRRALLAQRVARLKRVALGIEECL